ncbi:hypothetical protein [Paenibacillus popilliae]|uniref:Dehydrogenase (E1) component n=1 Tax=Paenibacillus popilliae ATCC 14706 TaxID=1212764 RepID=M9M4P0_PAEPP|nr:hypothetical protein [Paenibacillus popilliae]GAC42258.1 dehydrogenase (E1) component [Paenibacillus popilliae ATCC 14706]
MWFKKMLSGIVACSLFFTLAGATYATPVGVKETYSADGRSFTVDKETVTAYVTVHEISATVDIEVVDKQTGQMLFEEDGVPFSKISPLLETSTEGKRKKRAVPIAIPFVVAGIEKLVTITGIGTVLYAKHKMEERSSAYKDVTNKGSVKNVQTDVTKEEFGKNLESNGWSKSKTKDGGDMYKKDGAKYTTRDKSNQGQKTADYTPKGQKKASTKIRLKD